MKTKEINIKELEIKNVKKLKSDIAYIKDTVYELNGLTADISFVEIDELDKNIIKKLVERCRCIYENCDINTQEAHKIAGIINKIVLKKYIKQLNIYLNAIAIWEFAINNYIKEFSYKFGTSDDINSIYTYYIYIGNMLDSIGEEYYEYIENLGIDYYE